METHMLHTSIIIGFASIRIRREDKLKMLSLRLTRGTLLIIVKCAYTLNDKRRTGPSESYSFWFSIHRIVSMVVIHFSRITKIIFNTNIIIYRLQTKDIICFIYVKYTQWILNRYKQYSWQRFRFNLVLKKKK